MKRTRVLAAAALLAIAPALGAADVPDVADVTEAAADNAVDATTDLAPVRVARPTLLSYAAQLSALPAITGPSGWRIAGQTAGWAGLIASQPTTRQETRWLYATHQIALGRGPEAVGALEVMRQDDPDLTLVPSFQLAMGATLTLLDRPGAAIAALAGDALQANPEACAWRMLALARGGMAQQALAQARCALPALNQRSVKARAPFLMAIANVALESHRPALAVQLLTAIPAKDPAANVLRGRAEIALGRQPQGKLLLATVVQSGNRQQRLDAELSLIEDSARQRALSAQDSARLRQIRYIWRGGDIEMRALLLTYTIARRTNDVHGTLESGATLFRYFAGGPDRPALVAALQETLTAGLAAGTPLPLDQIAGLYWDYRDLLPAGASGDLLVVQLADRLQAAGLYGRGAELLDHQLRLRTRDIAQGPLSARVASLFILAGEPKRALAAVRDTEGNSYPDDMLWARHRVEAVALDQLGRTNEALAVLQDVPDGEAIRSEFYWRRHDWTALAATALPALDGTATLNDVAQAKILRLAVALAMLGRESELARLRARFGAGFAKLPTAPAFAALTSAVGAIDPATISAAMAAIPSASPAGEIADLIDAAPQVAERVGRDQPAL